MKLRSAFPELGIGVGLRATHYAHILERHPPVGWFEIISENYMDTEGRPLHVLERVAEDYPIVMHGVSLSIGSADPLDRAYLKRLKRLAERIGAKWVTDHLCWTGVAGKNTHDLLPMPYDEPSLRHVVKRVKQVQEILERPIGLENPSSYVEFRRSTMPEWEFLGRVADEAGCGILLDVNNVHVSAFNHGFDAHAYIDGVPHERVVQYHLAGHTNKGTHILDTHNDHVIDAVWDLYGRSVEKSGGRPTLLEWDDDIPEFEVVHEEARKALRYLQVAHAV